VNQKKGEGWKKGYRKRQRCVIALLAGFRHAGHQWSFLRVFVAAFASEAEDFAASAGNGLPVVACAVGAVFMDFP
jgi:hypothetical protein